MQDDSVPFLMRTRTKALLYLLILLSVALFSITDQDPRPLVITMIAASVAWLVVDAPRKGGELPVKPAPKLEWTAEGLLSYAMTSGFHRPGRGLPKLPLNIIVLAGAIYLWIELLDAWGNKSIITALAHFIILLVNCKLFEDKTLRDMVQMLVLSLLVVISSAMFSNANLLYAILGAIYVGVLGYGHMTLHLGVETQFAARKKLPAALPELARLRRLRLDLRFTARNCILMILPVMIVMFFVVPRSRRAGFASPWPLGAYSTGYRDNVQFQETGQLNPSDAVAMRVKFWRDGAVYIPDPNDLYFRGEVLTEYNKDAGRWQAAPNLLPSAKPDEALPPARDRPRDWSGVITESYVIERSTLAATPRTRFVQGPVIASSLPANGSFVSDSRYMTLRDSGSTLQYMVQSPARPEWWEWEWTNEDTFVTPGLLRAERSYQARAVPGEIRVVPAVWVTPQITELAREIAKDYLPPAGQPVPNDSIKLVVNVFENYLRTNYRYSLTFRQVDPKLDFTTDFLLNRKSTGGHCEYFASAMVMLCRAVGINARMVTGYHGGELNVVSNDFTVRQRDAHSWAEIYVEGEGWIRSDPTPSQVNAGLAGDYSIWQIGRQFGQMLQNLWSSVVVSFDNESRNSAWEWALDRLRALSHVFRDAFAFSLASDWQARLTVFGPLLGLLITGGWVFRRWRADRKRWRLIHGSRWQSVVPLSAGIWFVDEMFGLLERHGDARRLDQTPREYVEQFHERLGTSSGQARWLIQLAYEVRFGGLHVDAALRDKVHRSLREVRAALGRKAAPA